MSDESMWIERAQSCEASLKAYKHANAAAVERVKAFKTAFGLRETSDGSIVINFDKFVLALGEAQANELRDVIEKTYGKDKAA
jgi:hypothetical protein